MPENKFGLVYANAVTENVEGKGKPELVLRSKEEFLELQREKLEAKIRAEEEHRIAEQQSREDAVPASEFARQFRPF